VTRTGGSPLSALMMTILAAVGPTLSAAVEVGVGRARAWTSAHRAGQRLPQEPIGPGQVRS